MEWDGTGWDTNYPSDIYSKGFINRTTTGMGLGYYWDGGQTMKLLTMGQAQANDQIQQLIIKFEIRAVYGGHCGHQRHINSLSLAAEIIIIPWRRTKPRRVALGEIGE